MQNHRKSDILPIAFLMIEHRLIERVITLLKTEVGLIEKDSRIDFNLIEQAVDFFRNYADRCHHGKEEDILFKALAAKELSSEHREIMRQLMEEHVQGRKIIADLSLAAEKYSTNKEEMLKNIKHYLKKAVDLYPRHIEKEDKHFFIPCLKYFSKEEQIKMKEEFLEFDGKLFHENYRKIAENLEKQLQ